MLSYSGETWDTIVRDARRAATRQGMMAAYAGFVAVIVVACCSGMISFRGTLAKVIGLTLFASLFLVPAALAGLTYLGAYRLTIERRCRASRLCERCGYDLRASENRCPECGKRIRTTPGEAVPS